MIARVLVVAAAVAAPGCGDDSCGPGSASTTGLTVSGTDVTLTYGNLTSGKNNDCRDPSVPDIISLTIEGTQIDGPPATAFVVLCIPRPDQLAAMEQAIGTGIRIIEVRGDKAGCTYVYNSARAATGTVRASGMCDNGLHEAGYALTLDGNIALQRTCGTTVDTIDVALGGTFAVAKRPD